jgi:hypothetical protein
MDNDSETNVSFNCMYVEKHEIEKLVSKISSHFYKENFYGYSLCSNTEHGWSIIHFWIMNWALNIIPRELK